MSSANPFRQEIVFIVDNLSDWQMLADAARQRGHEVVIVDSNSDGLRQIAGYLSGKPAGSVDAIHLLSHGSAGQIDLGSLTLALDTLPRHAGSLEEIGQAMSEKGDFLLYGCNAAASPEGVALMEGIATLTRADVAASTTMTGHTRFGGDWHLETHSGFIETPSLKIADYASTLALVSFTGDSGNSNSPDATLSNGPASLITITNTATSDALDIAINGTQLFHDTVTNIQSLGIATPTGSSGMILIMPTGEFASSITLSVQGGKSFDFVSMLLMESFDVNETFTFTPNGNAAKKVDVSFSNGQTQTVNLSSNADFDNLSTLTISSSDGNFQAYFDNIQLENIGGGNTPPSIGGAVASQAVNDIATISPFSTLTIEDADNNNVSVTVTLDTAAKGVFTPASLTASGFADATGGSYTLASTTTSAAQAAIRQLVFDPANNRVAVGNTETTSFTIAVNDGTDSTPNTSTTVVSTSINDAPTDIALGNTSVNQSAATNAPVGTLSSTDPDPDPGSSFTYTLVAGSGDTNNSLFNISGTSLRANDATTMAPGNYSIRVRSTDGGGLFYEEVFAITVNDNVAPVFDESTPSTANIAATALDLNASLNEAGTIYYVVLADGASASSAAQVKAGQDASGAAALKAGNAAVSSGAFTHTFNLNGLTAETAYDIYVVGQDDEGTPNLMATPTKRDVTTAQAGPSVTDAHISITSTPTGSASTYKVGDTVTAQWDNSASGQNQTGVTGVTMDFSAFGGGTAVTATNNGSGIWSASYVLAAGSIDAGNRNVSVSATDGNGTTSTADSSNLTVDNQAPGVGDARISISGASGTGGAYKIGDT
ncbi:DUF4347 domain-containing protein, partial [Azonexus sp.]|uniref:DUF4347 domain-containing protein n=1 Tax=Azonexus sp. TaxID=1872668 RepID=UPI0027B95B47